MIIFGDDSMTIFGADAMIIFGEVNVLMYMFHNYTRNVYKYFYYIQ